MRESSGLSGARSRTRSRGSTGYVAKYMGDGVLVYFGYPRAHEDDAERAVRAGLAAVDGGRAASMIRRGGRSQPASGSRTGLVVVGDLIGEGAAQEQAVVGETPNLAARLQALAEPDTVGDRAAHAAADRRLFDFRDLGSYELKGFADRCGPGGCSARARREPVRGAARPGLTPLVGREQEIELLLGAGSRPRAARARWCCSPASRASASRVSSRPCRSGSRASRTRACAISARRIIRTARLPDHRQLERAAGFEREDTPETKLEKLEALLAPTMPPQEDLALLAELLSLPAAARSLRRSNSARNERERRRLRRCFVSSNFSRGNSQC